jgi:integrase
VKGYEEHVDLHIVPFIGSKKLSDLTVPAINAVTDQLREAGLSAAMIKKVVRSLGAFMEARRRGLSNVAPTVGLELDLPKRDDPRPVIPTKQEPQAIIAGATAHKNRIWRALALAVFHRFSMQWALPHSRQF